MSQTANESRHSLVAGALSSYASLPDITATGTATALASSTACIQVVVQAHSGNAALMVRVGDASITSSRGLQLAAGASVALSVADLADVYVLAESGSPKVCVLYAKESP